MYALPITRTTGAPGGGGTLAPLRLLLLRVNAPMKASPSHSTITSGGTITWTSANTAIASITVTLCWRTASRRSTFTLEKTDSTRRCRGTAQRPSFRFSLKTETIPRAGVVGRSSRKAAGCCGLHQAASPRFFSDNSGSSTQPPEIHQPHRRTVQRAPKFTQTCRRCVRPAAGCSPCSG